MPKMLTSGLPFKLSIFSAGLLMVFLDCNAAQADEQLEVIEVSAQRHLQPLKQVPVSVTLLDAEEIASLSNPSIEQASERLPAVFAAPNSGSSKLFMRGIGSQGNAGMDQTVAVYLDDVYHGRSRIIKTSLFDTKNMEIYKGPQSLYFGLNTTGGVISLHSQQANLSQSEGELALTVGENQTYGLDLARTISVNDSLAIRPALHLNKSDGYWDMIDSNGNVVADSNNQQQAARISITWKALEKLQFSLKLESQNNEHNNPYAWQPGGCNNLYGLNLSNQQELNAFWQETGSQQDNPLRVPYTCREQFIDNQFDQSSPSAPFNDSELTHNLVLLKSFWHGDNYDAELISAYYDTEFGFAGNDLSHGANFKRLYWSEDQGQQHSQELRLRGKFSPQLDWFSGLYWHDSQIYYATSDLDARRQENQQLSFAQAWQKERRLAVFAALQWQLNEQFSLSPGLRWNRTHKNFDGLNRQYRAQFQSQAERQIFLDTLTEDVQADPTRYSQFSARVTNEFTDQQHRFTTLLPSIRLSWQPKLDSYIWYKWQKAAKGGGFNFRLNNLDASELRYDEENARSHELGFRQQLLNNRMSLSAVLFHTDYRSLQQNSNMGDDGFIAGALIRNIAAARSKGIELELAWQLSATLQLSGNATWLDAQFTRYPGADCTRLQSVVSNTDVAALFGAQREQSCFQDLSGARMPFAPEFSLSTTLKHTYHISANYQLISSLNWFYSDEYFTSPHADTLRQQPDFHKLHLNLSLLNAKSPWKISLHINNLTNKLTTGQLGQDGNAAVSGLLDSPRQVLVRAEIKI